jgi:hypothetical protein
MSESNVSSFIIRFVEDPAAADQPPPASWRGLIRHVQSNQEIRFSTIGQALAFMNRFVALGEAVVLQPAEGPAPGSEALDLRPPDGPAPGGESE